MAFIKSSLLSHKFMLRINFPKLYPSGKADIVYSACVCTHRMAKARYRNNDDIAFVQKQIRRYEKDFLIYGKNRIATKLFLTFENSSILYNFPHATVSTN